MTRDELLAALAPPRLPLEMAAIGWREGLALLAAGFLAGLVLTLLIRPWVAARPSWKARVRATRGLPAQDRILAVTRILGRMPPALRDAAYGAAPAPDDAVIDAAARRTGPASRRKGQGA